MTHKEIANLGCFHDQHLDQSRAAICESGDLILALADVIEDAPALAELIERLGEESVSATINMCVFFAVQVILKDRHQRMAEANGVVQNGLE